MATKKKTADKPMQPTAKARYHERVKSGTCVVTGCKKKATANCKMCKEHKEHKAAYMRDYMKRLRDAAKDKKPTKPIKKKEAKKVVKKANKPKAAKTAGGAKPTQTVAGS